MTDLVSGTQRAILLVDHGSRRVEAHNQLLEIAARLQEKMVRENSPMVVEVAHMEISSPDIAAGIAACVLAGASNVLIIPCFLSRGRHVTEDIPLLVEEAVSGFPDLKYRVAPPLLEHGGFIDLLFSAASDE